MSKTTKPDCEFQLKKYKEGQIPSTVCQYKETEGIYYIDCDYEQEEEECPIKKLLEENRRLKGQLKQRDEVIDEAIKYIDEKNKVDDYLDGVPCNDLLEILQRCKGDSDGNDTGL